MKKIVLAFFLFFLTSEFVNSQVFEYPLGATDNSIVRSVGNGCVLMYTQDSPTISYFVYSNEVNGNNLAFQLPSWLRVQDFRIFDNRAYFCGTTGTSAVIGMFNINNVFYSGGGLNCLVLYSLIGSTIMLEDLTRLQLFEDRGNVCMAMVGKSIFDPYVQHKSKNVIVSAYYDGTQWHVCCDISKPDTIIKYTDIACLDDIIVVVGSDTNDVGCYFKTYKRQLDFPAYPCIPNYAYQFNILNPVGKSLVTKYAGNVAAIVHYEASGATVLHRVPFFSNGNVDDTSGLSGTWINTPPPPSPLFSRMDMLELVTAPNMYTYLLQSTQYPLCTLSMLREWLVRFDYNTALTSTVPAVSNDYESHSMDIDYTVPYPRLSCKSNYSLLTTFAPITNMYVQRCDFPDEITLQYSRPTVIKPKINEGAISEAYSGYNIPQTVFSPTKHIICN